MAKEAFNRKSTIFCGPLEKTTEKTSEVLCVVCTVVWLKTLTLRRNEQKQLEAFEMWVWRRIECVKWTDKIKNTAVLEILGEERLMRELIMKRGKMAGPLAKK